MEYCEPADSLPTCSVIAKRRNSAAPSCKCISAIVHVTWLASTPCQLAHLDTFHRLTVMHFQSLLSPIACAEEAACTLQSLAPSGQTQRWQFCTCRHHT